MPGIGKMRSTKKRKPKLTRLEKMTKGLMLSNDEIKSKFSVREVEGKGRALFLNSKIIRKDSFVLEYEGDVIAHDEAEFRERIYETNDEGCYILFFRFQEKRLAIDATRKFDSYARYLNHSRDPNIRFHPPLLLDLTGQGVPRIAAYALRDINQGEEIVFDYGIKDGSISWLRNKESCHESELKDSSSENESSSSEDDEASKKDQIMSVTRTPNKNLTLKPSKYLPPLRMPMSNPKPAKLTLPRDGFGIRYIAYPSGPDKRKCYIGSLEGLGQPLKIMRSVEERPSSRQQNEGCYESSHSVISLSESDDLSAKSPTNVTAFDNPSKRKESSVPFNATPSSASKVLEWQQKMKSSSANERSGASHSDLQILDVTSLHEENKTISPPSPSPLMCSVPSSDNCLQHKTPNDTKQNFPCISNVMNGSSVPTDFVPNMHLDLTNCSRHRIISDNIPPHSSQSVPSSSFPHSPKLHPSLQEPNHQSSLPQHPQNHLQPQTYVERNDSDHRRMPVKCKSPKQPNQEEMICLSDSEEEVVDGVSISDIGADHQTRTSVSVKDQTSPFKNECTGVKEVVISGVQSLKRGSANHIQRSKVHTVYQNQMGEVHTVFNNNKRGEVHTVGPSHTSLTKEINTENHEQTKNIHSGTVQYEYQDKSGGTVRYEYLNSQKDSLPSQNINGDKDSKKRQEESATKKKDVVDFVEIDDESDLEIISDGELPSSSASSVKPSSSSMLSVPFTDRGHCRRHQPQPHVAIVKPYSQENDQLIILEENDAVEVHHEKAADYDVIEVVEGNSSENDDDIICTEGKTSRAACSDLTQQEIQTMQQIFQPLILSSDSLSPGCVEKAINENFNFFSVLIGRGVPVNEIRKTVWNLFKDSKNVNGLHV